MLMTLRAADKASEANSASLNLPGRIHVIDLNVDSREEMVETFLMRKVSYRARADDIEIGTEKRAGIETGTTEGRLSGEAAARLGLAVAEKGAL